MNRQHPVQVRRPSLHLALACAALGLHCAWPSLSHAQSPTPPPRDNATLQARRIAATEAQERLRQAWRVFGERNARGEFRPDPFAAGLQPKILSAPELRTLYTTAGVPFPEPDVIHSKDGKLEATLTVAMAHNKIGSDPVYLRNYNGKLVGPTLRCKPGDTLYITLKNDLEPEAYEPGAMDTLHSFNTTNLHFHGLHVSPSGISDNVLLSVGPGSTQKYVVAIPGDHPCGTFWYHAHLHGSTAANTGSGMSGALIIEGDMDAVPEIAAAEERVFVLQQIPYINNETIKSKVCQNIPPGTDLPEGVVEAAYSDCIFGPHTWDALGRYTTINGVKLPIIKMRPGSVERWRLVDSAVREVIQPELVRHENSNPAAPSQLIMHEIAVDGLPLGRVADRSGLELWPGYRSDVLVQAPMEVGAQYVLRDTRIPESGDTFSEERRYLALVVVEGEPKTMKLPSDAEIAGFRLPSIDPLAVTGREVASYGIIPTPDGTGVTFTVDRTPFGNDEARQLTVGEVHEWTLISRNNVGPVSHPFHIHVNPFEIFSWVDAQGKEQLDHDANGKVLPVWRDTIILHEGWKVSCRTHYTDFAGVFVQHCHILDHEDQGMMELIQINPAPTPAAGAPAGAAALNRPLQPYPAPDWALPDVKGQERRLSTMLDGPTLLVFFEGFGCLRCNAQVQALIGQYDAFQKRGVKIIGISTDTVAALDEALKVTPCPFPIVADPEKRVFRAYGCYAGAPLHGAFLLDATSTVRWQAISTEPYRNFETIFREAGLMTTATTVSSAPQQLAADRR